MTQCVLRVRGKPFDVDRFLATSSFRVDQVWREGDATRKGVAKDSGFSVVVSSSESDQLSEQMQGAIEFLDSHREEFRRIASEPTVEAGLDFAKHRHDPLAMAEYSRFSRSMVTAAAEWGLYLEISHYMVQEDDDDADA